MIAESNANGNGTITSTMTSESIKGVIHRELIDTIDLDEARKMSIAQLQTECTARVDRLLSEHHCPLSAPERQQLLGEVLDEIFGLGPLEQLLRDPAISDILVNGPDQVYVERFGQLEKTAVRFRDHDHLLQIIHRTAVRVGRHVDEASPMLDARLEDGSRVNAIIPPLALHGAALSIRRFGAVPIDMARLIELQAVTEEMALFLEACVRCRVNILIAGGTGSGKTTLLNVMSKAIPEAERIVTIEDAAELKLQQEHVVALETRPPNIEGKGEITQRDLLRNTLRMRPDRIIIGEVRGAEALDMMQAMNTGHEGSMTTVHANSARDAMRRIENMVSMAGLNYPVHAIREQMASALDLLVHLSRLTGGRRKIMSIAEITGMENDVICLQELFCFRQSGVDESGHAKGRFEACGVRPQLLTRLQDKGAELPIDLFRQRILDVAPAA